MYACVYDWEDRSLAGAEHQMPFVAGGDEGGILHHLYKGPDAMPRGTLGGTSGPLMIERPISAVEAIARGAALPSSETADSGKVPAIVTENMPGAGSFAGFPLDSAVGGSGKTNAAEFHYVGRVNTSAWSWSTVHGEIVAANG